MIPSDILQRTFNIRYAGATGTAFTAEANGVQHLLSCRHNFPFAKPGDVIEFEIRQGNEWIPTRGTAVFDANSQADMLALSLDRDISPRHAIRVQPADFYLGERAYFLGFPLGKYADDHQGVNNSYPIPFAKSGIISTPIIDNAGVQTIYFDGFNNAGFSGGPLFTISPRDNSVNVIGIVMGYLPEERTAHTAMGKIWFESNSGIVEAHAMVHLTAAVPGLN